MIYLFHRSDHWTIIHYTFKNIVRITEIAQNARYFFQKDFSSLSQIPADIGQDNDLFSCYVFSLTLFHIQTLSDDF